jgi:ribulose 1,5-bisphosphate carboxylase large subunit-like protein
MMQIKFTTFRHWKGTVEYHRTKDIIHVQQLLGHRNIKNTMIYINYDKAVFGEGRCDEFTVKVAGNIDEDKELIEAGFEYVTVRDGLNIYRKRK